MLTPEKQTEFVRLGRGDIEAVAALERRCFHPPWSEEQWHGALAGAAFAAFALKQRDSLVAYAAVYQAAGELEILNIAVIPEQRGTGLGGRLLGLVLREAEKMGIVRSVLEVRPSNTAAIRLYTSHGYTAVGRRKGYYPDTGEDALMYAKEFAMLPIIAANWKMYKTVAEAKETASGLLHLAPHPACDVVIFAPFTALAATRASLTLPRASVGAQDVYPAAEGAFTGEISPAMVRDAGCEWVLTGHSERRHVLGESMDFVGKKTAFSLASGLRVMLCIGETLAERESGALEQVLRQQLEAGLRDVPAVSLNSLALAYEPVWAIGTGKTATEADIVDTHAVVRRLLAAQCGDIGQTLPILYGGSVKPDNAAGILALDNVGGLLVGGASLQAESFAAIIRAAQA